MNLKIQVDQWLDTWGPHCGAPREVFEGQFRATLSKIFDEIERRDELEGSYYVAMTGIRTELGIPRKP